MYAKEDNEKQRQREMNFPITTLDLKILHMKNLRFNNDKVAYIVLFS